MNYESKPSGGVVIIWTLSILAASFTVMIVSFIAQWEELGWWMAFICATTFVFMVGFNVGVDSE